MEIGRAGQAPGGGLGEQLGLAVLGRDLEVEFGRHRNVPLGVSVEIVVHR
jgi:hypothetical protein